MINIVDESRAWEILQHLSDPYSIRILSATLHRPLDAITMSNMLDIPIAVCYRRIRELEELGLIEKAGRKLTKKGKWINLYKAKIKDAEMKMENGKIFLKIKFRYGKEDELEFG